MSIPNTNVYSYDPDSSLVLGGNVVSGNVNLGNNNARTGSIQVGNNSSSGTILLRNAAPGDIRLQTDDAQIGRNINSETTILGNCTITGNLQVDGTTTSAALQFVETLGHIQLGYQDLFNQTSVNTGIFGGGVEASGDVSRFTQIRIGRALNYTFQASATSLSPILDNEEIYVQTELPSSVNAQVSYFTFLDLGTWPFQSGGMGVDKKSSIFGIMQPGTNRIYLYSRLQDQTPTTIIKSQFLNNGNNPQGWNLQGNYFIDE